MNSPSEKYVVDASVVVRWLIRGEEWEEHALKLRKRYVRGEIDLYSPTFSLLKY